MSDDPLLDHLEKTFADAYRKELDQEENVWRSLPFFAATLALEVTALAQVRAWAIDVAGPGRAVAIALLVVVGSATVAALVFLARSVWPADFRYVAREPAFREYAELVRAQAAEDERDPVVAAKVALRTIKAALAEQYATAANNNRRINQARALWRTRAGLATLISVLVVLVLVALAVVVHIDADVRSSTPAAGFPGTGCASIGNARSAPAEQRAAAADDRGSQGMV